MFVLAVSLLATVASVTPTAPTHAEAEPVASTYDQAACDLSDSGECAPPLVELELSLASPAPTVDSRDARLAEWLQPRFGSCDLPRAPSPWTRAAWLRNAAYGGSRHWRAALRPSAPAHAPPRLDDSHLLLATTPSAFVASVASPIVLADEAPPSELPPFRLERPPRP
jgi:hypothetical protein